MNTLIPRIAKEVDNHVTPARGDHPGLMVSANAPAWVMNVANSLQYVCQDHWASDVVKTMLMSISELSSEDAFEGSPSVNAMTEHLTASQFVVLDADIMKWAVLYGEEVRYSVRDTLAELDDNAWEVSPFEVIQKAEVAERQLILNVLINAMIAVQGVATDSADQERTILVSMYNE